MLVDWLQEASIGVLLKHLCPFQKHSQRLGVQSFIELSAVEYVDLHNQGLVLLHVVVKRVCREVIFRIRFSLVGFILED